MHDSNWKAFAAGVTAGLIMTVGAALARALEVSKLNVELLIGSVVGSTGEGAWILGLAIHLLASGLIGMAYGAAFRNLNRSGALVGAAFGLFHWIVSGAMLGALPSLHPMVPEAIAYPGYYASALGLGSAVVTLLLHSVFGAALGALYDVAGPDAIFLQDNKYFRNAA